MDMLATSNQTIYTINCKGLHSFQTLPSDNIVSFCNIIYVTKKWIKCSWELRHLPEVLFCLIENPRRIWSKLLKTILDLANLWEAHFQLSLWSPDLWEFYSHVLVNSGLIWQWFQILRNMRIIQTYLLIQDYTDNDFKFDQSIATTQLKLGFL